MTDKKSDYTRQEIEAGRKLFAANWDFVAAAKSKVTAWTGTITAYLRGRANLARVYVLIDSRHGLKDTDDAMFKELSNSAVSHQVVLTKCDAIKPSELAARIVEVEAALAKRPGAFPGVIATSSHEGTGMDELRAAVARLLDERKR